MLYLSATGIKDHLDCAYRLYLRREKPKSAIVSDDAIFGGIVHEGIEKYDTYDDALAFGLAEWDRLKNDNRFLPTKSKPPKSFRKMFKGYYNSILEEINADGFEQAERELKFKIPWRKNEVMLVGKWDRVQENKLFDWKTGMRPPDKYDLRDFQFCFYDLAYELVYGQRPEQFYGYLYGGSLYPIDIPEQLRYNTVKLVDRVADELLEQNEPLRVTGYQCKRCFYREICHNELDNRSIPA